MHKLLVQQKQAQAAQTRQMQQILSTLNAHIAECRTPNVSIQKKGISLQSNILQLFYFEKVATPEGCSNANVAAGEQLGTTYSVTRADIGGHSDPATSARANAAAVQPTPTIQSVTRPTRPKMSAANTRKNAVVSDGGLATAKVSETGKRKPSTTTSTTGQKAVRQKKSKSEDLIIPPPSQPQSFEACFKNILRTPPTLIN